MILSAGNEQLIVCLIYTTQRDDDDDDDHDNNNNRVALDCATCSLLRTARMSEQVSD